MKAFLAAVVVTVGLAWGTSAVLERYQVPATTAYTTSGVRLSADELGHR